MCDVALGGARLGEVAMTAAVPTEALEGRARLGHVPALDGLRGAAVLVVLAYHGGAGWARGGFLGVSLFFTLSGFLITALLVSEHAGTGRIRLRSFWSRRVRRLAPAGLLGLALSVVAMVVAVPIEQRAAAMVDVRHALAQIANWRFIWTDAPYAGLDTLPSPVLHYWSLAIEEQFYLLFPLVALAALKVGRRALGVALGAVVVLSLWRQAVLSGDRVYFGTDTRAAEIALGGLLALGWRAAAHSRALAERGWRRGCDAAGAMGVAATLVLWARAEQSDPTLLGGGLVAVACLSCLVLVGALGGGHLSAALSWRPLRAVGLVSYGVYVVHWPVFLMLTPDRVGVEGPLLFAVRLAATAAIAIPSYLFLEQPVRRGAPWPRPVVAGAVATTLVLLVATVPVARGFAADARRAQAPVATGFTSTPSTWVVAAPTTGGQEPGTGIGDEANAVAESETASVTVPPSGQPVTAAEAVVRRAPRVVVVGDSTAAGLGEGLQAWGDRTGGLLVSVVSRSGCPVLPGQVARYREGYEFRPAGCNQLFAVAAAEAERIDADAIVVFMGSAQVADWRYGNEDIWRSILEPAIADRYRSAVLLAVDLLGAPDVPVLWADLPVPEWDLDAFGGLIGGRKVPGTGEPVTNDPDRTAVLNRSTGEALDQRGAAVLVPFAAGLAGPDGVIEPGDRADGLHLSAEQAAAAAEDWLVAALARAHEQALAELGERPPLDLSWVPGG